MILCRPTRLIRALFAILLAAAFFVGCNATPAPSSNVVPAPTTPRATNPTGTEQETSTPTGNHAIKTVFLILMENHNWSEIKGNASAPYINHTLLPMASYAQQYYNPPGNHPSLPNYLWLEAGTNFGIYNDDSPYINHQNTTQHLTTLLNNARISWKAYEEDTNGQDCPLLGLGSYATKHDPMVYFNDVTNDNNIHSAYCIAHVRPFSQLSPDLAHNSEGRYNFITPNLCDDMHDPCFQTLDTVRQGDNWLAKQIPIIMHSTAYKNGGVIFITWDEASSGDGPIGMIVLSPAAKGNGYSNTIYYTHSSTLRTVEEIFGVTPLLGAAAKATDLSDLFRTFP